MLPVITIQSKHNPERMKRTVYLYVRNNAWLTSPQYAKINIKPGQFFQVSRLNAWSNSEIRKKFFLLRHLQNFTGFDELLLHFYRIPKTGENM